MTQNAHSSSTAIQLRKLVAESVRHSHSRTASQLFGMIHPKHSSLKNSIYPLVQRNTLDTQTKKVFHGSFMRKEKELKSPTIIKLSFSKQSVRTLAKPVPMLPRILQNSIKSHNITPNNESLNSSSVLNSTHQLPNNQKSLNSLLRNAAAKQYLQRKVLNLKSESQELKKDCQYRECTQLDMQVVKNRQWREHHREFNSKFKHSLEHLQQHQTRCQACEANTTGRLNQQVSHVCNERIQIKNEKPKTLSKPKIKRVAKITTRNSSYLKAILEDKNERSLASRHQTNSKTGKQTSKLSFGNSDSRELSLELSNTDDENDQHPDNKIVEQPAAESIRTLCQIQKTEPQTLKTQAMPPSSTLIQSKPIRANYHQPPKKLKSSLKRPRGSIRHPKMPKHNKKIGFNKQASVIRYEPGSELKPQITTEIINQKLQQKSDGSPRLDYVENDFDPSSSPSSSQVLPNDKKAARPNEQNILVRSSQKIISRQNIKDGVFLDSKKSFEEQDSRLTKKRSQKKKTTLALNPDIQSSEASCDQRSSRNHNRVYTQKSPQVKTDIAMANTHNKFLSGPIDPSLDQSVKHMSCLDIDAKIRQITGQEEGRTHAQFQANMYQKLAIQKRNQKIDTWLVNIKSVAKVQDFDPRRTIQIKTEIQDKIIHELNMSLQKTEIDGFSISKTDSEAQKKNKIEGLKYYLTGARLQNQKIWSLIYLYENYRKLFTKQRSELAGFEHCESWFAENFMLLLKEVSDSYDGSLKWTSTPAAFCDYDSGDGQDTYRQSRTILDNFKTSIQKSKTYSKGLNKLDASSRSINNNASHQQGSLQGDGQHYLIQKQLNSRTIEQKVERNKYYKTLKITEPQRQQIVEQYSKEIRQLRHMQPKIKISNHAKKMLDSVSYTNNNPQDLPIHRFGSEISVASVSQMFRETLVAIKKKQPVFFQHLLQSAKNMHKICS